MRKLDRTARTGFIWLRTRTRGGLWWPWIMVMHLQVLHNAGEFLDLTCSRTIDFSKTLLHGVLPDHNLIMKPFQYKCCQNTKFYSAFDSIPPVKKIKYSCWQWHQAITCDVFNKAVTRISHRMMEKWSIPPSEVTAAHTIYTYLLNIIEQSLRDVWSSIFYIRNHQIWVWEFKAKCLSNLDPKKIM